MNKWLNEALETFSKQTGLSIPEPKKERYEVDYEIMLPDNVKVVLTITSLAMRVRRHNEGHTANWPMRPRSYAGTAYKQILNDFVEACSDGWQLKHTAAYLEKRSGVKPTIQA